MERELFALLWTDDDGAQCAIYEDRDDAFRDALLVGGRVESRRVHVSTARREGRFSRPQG